MDAGAIQKFQSVRVPLRLQFRNILSAGEGAGEARKIMSVRVQVLFMGQKQVEGTGALQVLKCVR